MAERKMPASARTLAREHDAKLSQADVDPRFKSIGPSKTLRRLKDGASEFKGLLNADLEFRDQFLAKAYDCARRNWGYDTPLERAIASADDGGRNLLLLAIRGLCCPEEHIFKPRGPFKAWFSWLKREVAEALTGPTEAESIRLEITLRSLLDMMRQDMLVAGVPHSVARWKSKARKRRPSSRHATITDVQAHTLQIVGECNGNFAEAARKLGKDQKTVREAYEAGMRKLGAQTAKTLNQLRRTERPTSLPEDSRGQVNACAPSDRLASHGRGHRGRAPGGRGE